LIEKPKSNRGGARKGAGRKVDPLKDLRTGAITAQKLLKQLDAEKQVIELYPQLGPEKKLNVIFRLREDAYGRPNQRRDGGDEGNRPATVRVLIEHIGARVTHSLSAQTK
jgi:hypothetical protein